MLKAWVSSSYSDEEQAAMDELHRQAHKLWLDPKLREPDMESFRAFDTALKNVARVFGAEDSAISGTREGVRFDGVSPED